MSSNSSLFLRSSRSGSSGEAAIMIGPISKSTTSAVTVNSSGKSRSFSSWTL